jgi:hypothetical protein
LIENNNSEKDNENNNFEKEKDNENNNLEKEENFEEIIIKLKIEKFKNIEKKLSLTSKLSLYNGIMNISKIEILFPDIIFLLLSKSLELSNKFDMNHFDKFLNFQLLQNITIKIKEYLKIKKNEKIDGINKFLLEKILEIVK